MAKVETEYTLLESRSVTLDGAGSGFVVALGPTMPNERWLVKLVALSTTSGGGSFHVYRGNVTPSNQIDFTQQTSGDTSPSDISLQQGDYLSFEWRNGTPGAIGTVRVEGQRYIPGRRAY